MTKAQQKRLNKLAARINELTAKAFDIINDDPMAGEVWTSLNVIASAADQIAFATEDAA